MEISIKNVSKAYKNNKVLNDISFEFSSSRIYGVVGPNGIGKTTLFKCMVGLQDINSGEISISGNKISTDVRSCVVENISYLLSTGVINHLTGWDNVKMFGNLYEISDTVLNSLFEEFDLLNAKNKKVKNYSLGMKQRLALILSLVNIKRKIIILDEPYLGLDPIGIQCLNNKLLGLKKEGYLIIVSNHQLHESEKIFDEVIFLTDQRLISKTLNEEKEDLSEIFNRIYVERKVMDNEQR